MKSLAFMCCSLAFCAVLLWWKHDKGDPMLFFIGLLTGMTLAGLEVLYLHHFS